MNMTHIDNAITVTFTGQDRESVEAAAEARGVDPDEWVRRLARRQAGFDELAAASREWMGQPHPETTAWFASTRPGVHDLLRRNGEGNTTPNGWDHREPPQG